MFTLIIANLYSATPYHFFSFFENCILPFHKSLFPAVRLTRIASSTELNWMNPIRLPIQLFLFLLFTMILFDSNRFNWCILQKERHEITFSGILLQFTNMQTWRWRTETLIINKTLCFGKCIHYILRRGNETHSIISRDPINLHITATKLYNSKQIRITINEIQESIELFANPYQYILYEKQELI